ncbi:hypothetical protein [Haloferax denitrificans]|uniref:hypothetical protein n=1 Tax=Haloferax denitrificans TaxID=35745 RepID=UPI003C700844
MANVSPPSHSRRSVLKLTGALAVSGLAGCLGQPKYDRKALDEALSTPIPVVGPPSLPLPSGYLTTARAIAQEETDRLDSRLSNLPAGLDSDHRAVHSARDALSDARGLLGGQYPQTSPLDAIRYARQTLAEGHGWLDAVSGAISETDLRERFDDFRPLVAERREEIEYRATTVPTGIVVASAIEDRVYHANRALEAGSWDLDKTERVGSDERVQFLAMAAGEVEATRVALADAGAIIDGQRERVFENTPSLHGPMTAAAEALLDSVSETVDELDRIPTGQPVAAMVAAGLTPGTDQASEALDRDSPASALDALSGIDHLLRIRARFLEQLDADAIPTADSTASVMQSRTRAVDALRAAIESEPGPVERERLQRAADTIADGDQHLGHLRDTARRRDAAATDSARRATAAYLRGRYAAETANPAAQRVISAVENEM